MFMSTKQAQLIDVANRAKVAKSTVAAALRPGSGGKNARVSKETAARIRKIAEELGYRPNRLASGLRGASTSSVAAVWQFVDSWYHDASIANQLLARFQEDGRATYQAEHPVSPERLVVVLEDLLERRPDALMIQWRPDHFEHEGVRNVLRKFNAVLAVVPWPVEDMDIDQVVHDRSSAIREVVDHFKRTGRTRPTIVLNMADLSDQYKFRVFRDHCRQVGLPADESSIIDLNALAPRINDQVEQYIVAMERYTARSAPTDAIFCVNDAGVMAVAKFLRDRQVRIGTEMALIGLNDSPALRLWDPPLASVDRNHGELQQVIHEMVRRRLVEPKTPPERRTIHMRLVWRESAGGSPPQSTASALPL